MQEFHFTYKLFVQSVGHASCSDSSSGSCCEIVFSKIVFTQAHDNLKLYTLRDLPRLPMHNTHE